MRPLPSPLSAPLLALLIGTHAHAIFTSPPLPLLSRPVTITSETIDAPALKTLILGIGVGFDRLAGPQGMAIWRVLPDSPADNANLVIGSVITEINGVSTIGKTGEDCAKIIQNAHGIIRIKVLDPDAKERSLPIRKGWIALINPLF